MIEVLCVQAMQTAPMHNGGYLFEQEALEIIVGLQLGVGPLFHTIQQLQTTGANNIVHTTVSATESKMGLRRASPARIEHIMTVQVGRNL